MLVKSYKIEDAAGVTGGSAVVVGANADGNCKKPAAANAVGFLGITLETQANQLKGVAVQKSGIARARCIGGWTRGDWLAIGDNTGALASVQATVIAAPGVASRQNVVGIAEATVATGGTGPVWIAPGIVNIAVS
jgi:hypothetical protein